MTLDEGILMCECEAEKLSKCAEYGLISVGKALYAERAMEYSQIVEWLKELKERRENNPFADAERAMTQLTHQFQLQVSCGADMRGEENG